MEKIINNKKSKKCHIIPQFLIKQFFNNKYIWNLKIKDSMLEKLSIEDSACYDDFYVYDGDDSLEKELSKWESRAAPIIKKINDSTEKIELSGKELKILKIFIIIQGIRSKESRIISSKKMNLKDIENAENFLSKYPILDKYFISILEMKYVPFISTNIFCVNLLNKKNTFPGNIFFPIGKKIIVFSAFIYKKDYHYELVGRNNNDLLKSKKEDINWKRNFSIGINKFKGIVNFNESLFKPKGNINLSYPYWYGLFKYEDDYYSETLCDEDLYEWNITYFDQEILEIIFLYSFVDSNIDFILFDDFERFKIFIETMKKRMESEYRSQEDWNLEEIKNREEAIEYLFCQTVCLEAHTALTNCNEIINSYLKKYNISNLSNK